MEIARWVILFALVGLVIWLLIDTIIKCGKKIKEKKAKELENENNQIDENDNK